MGKDLFIKYLQGICTDKEFEELVLWFKLESQTVSGREMIRQVWMDYEPEAGTVDVTKYNRILDKIHHQINIDQSSRPFPIQKRNRRIRVLNVLTRVAAILLLPVLLLLIYTNSPEKQQFTANNNELEIEVPAGGRMQVVLGDGTKVWLNAESKLSYPYQFKGNERVVKLSGEGFFDVAQNKEIPFIVKTDHLSVKATGTAFDVNAYPGEKNVETTLVEGHVILYDQSNQKIKDLTPNEYLKFNFDKNKYTMETGDINKYVAWKDGLLVFKNDPIFEVVKRLERWYNVNIEITDERVKDFTYTATFANESLVQALDFMGIATPIRYQFVPREKLPDGSYSMQKVLIGLKN